MAENKILPWAQGSGANIMTDEEYADDSQRINGVISGIASSKRYNKNIRQVSAIAAGVAQFMVDNASNGAADVTDDMTPEEVSDYIKRVVENIVGGSHRGTYYNAFDSSGSTVYEVDSISVASGGSGYSVGNVAVIDVDSSISEYPGWCIVDAVDSSGAVTAVSVSSSGIFSSKPTDGAFDTHSDGGSGLTLSVTFKTGTPTTLNDIINPHPNQTAIVLHNERMGGLMWEFIYADRNGDGVFNWVESYQVDATAYIPASSTETVAGIARIATAAEASAGTDDTTIVTPSKLAGAVPALASGAGMPSVRFIDIPFSNYTAPEDGWISVSRICAQFQHITLAVNGLVAVNAISSSTSQTLLIYLPVKKGGNVVMTSNSSGAFQACRFIYADGVPA